MLVFVLLLRPTGRRWRPFRRASALFFPSSRDGISLRIVAFAPNQLGQHSPSSVDKPIANLIKKSNERERERETSLVVEFWEFHNRASFPIYLEHSKAGFFGENAFLIVAGVGIVAMIVKPLLEQPDRLFG